MQSKGLKRIQVVASGLRSLTKSSIVDPFGHAGQASLYKAFRPTYPKELVDKIEEITKGRDLALDLGCGTGQMTVPLVKEFGFRKVIGVDRSEAQLKQAEKHPSIEYVQGDVVGFMNDNIDENSVDLVTIAQTLHWIPIDGFLKAVHRVLRPKTGVLAVLGYGCPKISENEKAQTAFEKYYFQTLGSHYSLNDPRNMWDCDRVLLDTAHESQNYSLTFPKQSVIRTWSPKKWLPDPESTETDKEKEFIETKGAFFNYLRTQSAYNRLRTEKTEDPLENLQTQFTEPFVVTVPYWSIVCKKE